MRAEIIAVGTELLLGQITNTNARYLAQQCADLGVDVYYQTVVGDNAGRLRQALELAARRADIVRQFLTESVLKTPPPLVFSRENADRFLVALDEVLAGLGQP